MAFLTKNLKIVLTDKREENYEKVFHYEGGIKEFVKYLNSSKTPLYEDILYFEGKKTVFMWKLRCSIMIPIMNQPSAL